jgi:hypothetical protein
MRLVKLSSILKLVSIVVVASLSASQSWGLLCDRRLNNCGSQIPDPTYNPVITNPTYPYEYGGVVVPGPAIAVDNQHDNFHTIDDKYLGFYKLLTADRYSVDHFATKYVPGCINDLPNCEYFQRLLAIDRLVIANAQEAIGPEEAEVITGWLSGDLDPCTACSRSLILIADHQRNYNFPERIVELSTRLGLDWPNNNVWNHIFISDPPEGDPLTYGELNAGHTIVTGRSPAEEVVSVTTFEGSGFHGGPGLRGESLLTLQGGEPWTWTSGGNVYQEGGGYSQGIAFRFGKGTVYASGEAAMFTAQKVVGGGSFGMQTLPPNHNQQYLLNINHWLDGLMDQDGDGIPDGRDNCIDRPNGVNELSNQIDTNRDGHGNACDPDYDNDGIVGQSDYDIFNAAFGKRLGAPGYNPAADHNGDDLVGIADFGIFGQYYSQGPGESGLACADPLGSTAPCYDQHGLGDTDADHVVNFQDNCVLRRNGPNDPSNQIDADLDGFGNACDADYNNDGMTDQTDYDAFAAAYGSTPASPNYDADIDHNGDNIIGFPDYGIFGQLYGKAPGPSGRACADPLVQMACP